MIRMVIEMRAIPKGRPRFNSRRGIVHTPTKTKQFEKTLRKEIEALWFGEFNKQTIKKLTGLSLRITSSFVRPKSVSKKRKHVTVKPDLDNLTKSILDSMNKIVFEDDSQIIDLHLRKEYAEKELIIIEVSEET